MSVGCRFGGRGPMLYPGVGNGARRSGDGRPGIGKIEARLGRDEASSSKPLKMEASCRNIGGIHDVSADKNNALAQLLVGCA